MKENEGIEVEDEKFYLLTSKDKKWIYINEVEAIRALKRILGKNEDLNPAHVSLVEVRISGEEWEIKQVPWSRVTLLLIREGK